MAHQLAIVGFGGMGEWHCRSIQEKVPGLTVVGAYDIRPEQSNSIQEAGIRVYESLEELLADETVTMVTIATPNNYHKALSIACLLAGKHVICEKPVTMNAAELEEIMETARRTGRIFTIHHNRRWDTDYNIVREIIRTGIIGAPYFIESRVQGSRRVLNGWRGCVENGGGMLLDWGVHLIDQLMDMIDSPITQVCAQLLALMPGVEVDDNLKLTIGFENGVCALIEVATNCFILQPRWHVCCLEGTAVIDDWACNGQIVRLAEESEMAWDERIVYTEAGPTRTMAPRPPETTEQLALPAVSTNWTEFYYNVIAAIEGRESLRITPEQALRVMKVMDTAFESVRTGTGITCRI